MKQCTSIFVDFSSTSSPGVFPDFVDLMAAKISSSVGGRERDSIRQMTNLNQLTFQVNMLFSCNYDHCCCCCCR